MHNPLRLAVMATWHVRSSKREKSEAKSETVATFVSYYKPTHLFPLSSLLVGQSQNLWKSAQKQRVGQSQQIWIKCRIVSRFITSSLNIFAKNGHFGAS